MKILFCNITYMKNYTGITDEDMVTNGGSWVKKNKDANEQWNFLNSDGYCYGFVMNKGYQFAIERIDKEAMKSYETDDVIVVWCALNNEGETVIVGWYEHAVVYRTYMRTPSNPLYGMDRDYFCLAKAEDCYLLPENERHFRIGRASIEGTGKGFGQQNYWYAESVYARNELIPQVLEFLKEHKQNRINYTESDFTRPENYLLPLTSEETDMAYELLESGEYFDFLPYGYRLFYSNETADYAHNIAVALCGLHQYSLALEWYLKVIELEGESWENSSSLPYLYQQCGMYEESIEKAKKLLDCEQSNDIEAKHEIYGIIADDNMYLGNIQTAVSWLQKVIDESKNEELIRHAISVKENWLNS